MSGGAPILITILYVYIFTIDTIPFDYEWLGPPILYRYYYIYLVLFIYIQIHRILHDFYASETF